MTTSSFHDASAPTEWVVIRLSALGDVALTTGVLEYWHRTRGWTFTVITREAFAPVLDRHPAVRSIVGLAKEDLRFPRQLGVFRDLAEAHAGQGLLAAWHPAYPFAFSIVERACKTLSQTWP